MLAKLQLQREDHILDASAGTGILAKEISDTFGPFDRLVLNDPAEKMLQKAKTRLAETSNVEFTNCFCEELDFKPNSFDKILCLNSFHYYIGQEKVLNLFHLFLKPGGTLYLLDWNRKGWFTIVSSLIGLLSPENINTRSADEMSKMLTKSGFSVKEKEEWSFRWWKFYFMKCMKASE
ncbi:class I SAM-dependent methyltransferase [Rhodohalobacter halophilus]|uniref:class I SAM-dependent methyltransferase n=1 Tax=Rhodohalobacter halophilus TaxID=1812810 RepID=UPI00083F671D|nr:class I SAM-dependent methyltransferase [Rhodohalobacter halophilus]